jgi:hypothetical protein
MMETLMAMQARFANLAPAVTDALEAARRHDVDGFLTCFTSDARVEAWGRAHTTSASVERWARELLSGEQITDLIHAQLGASRASASNFRIAAWHQIHA